MHRCGASPLTRTKGCWLAWLLEIILTQERGRWKKMSLSDMKLFALKGSAPLGASIAANLGLSIAPHEEREFEVGEHKARPLEAVAGRDVYVVHSLNASPDQSPNDKLCRLLFFIGALKDAGAGRVTAVSPYL